MKKITISNIRNIGHLEFELPSPGLYVITGKNGSGKTTFNDYMSQRGSFRKKCKNESKRIVESLSEQTNESVDYIYKLIYKLSVDSLYDTPQINMLLASMIRR